MNHGNGPSHRPWRLLSADAGEPCPARDGAWNMAVDETLAESVAGGAAPVLRLYTWLPACVSLGRNQPARGRFDTQLAERRGIDIVRRPTGGLAVYHDRELTYAVAMPITLLGGPRRSYREINHAIMSGLRRLGVAASIAGIHGDGRVQEAAPLSASGRRGQEEGGLGGHAAAHPLTPTFAPGGERRRKHVPAPAAIAWREPCFREAARGEIVAGGRKLVGSAQRRERGVILQHGSILIAGDQAPVLELQHLADSRSPPPHGRPGSAARETAARSVTLHEVLGRCPDLEDIADAVVAGFEDLGGIRFAADSLTRDEQRRASRLSSRYRSDAWTWRR